VDHDVYVLVPGILGSVLKKDGKDVFGLTAGAGFRALFSAGGSIRDLRLSEPAWEPVDSAEGEVATVPDLGDGVTADRLAPDAHMVPGLWKVDGYGEIARFLRERLHLIPGTSYFEFPYDWRRDNRIAAHMLASRCREWLAERRAHYPDAKLVILGHSMGGLVARYYLEVLDGWRDTRRLITFGTPYRGSTNALDFVANGFTKLFGLVDLTELLCSFTSVHQLMPIYRCVDVGDPEMARLVDVPSVVPRLTPAQVLAARRFHTEIEDAVARHRQDDEYRERGYEVRPVVGIDQPTYQSARWQGDKLHILRSYEGADVGGDGTVPRFSASPQEAESEDGAMFSSDKHASLQNARGVHTQVRGWLRQIDLGKFLASRPTSVSVDTAEVHQAGQPVSVQLTTQGTVRRLAVSLTWVGGPEATDAGPESIELPFVSGVREFDFAAKDPGVYRVQVASSEIETTSDLIVVAPV
jgi:pimeloyl-ACP methyl ester carboxylesterase